MSKFKSAQVDPLAGGPALPPTPPPAAPLGAPMAPMMPPMGMADPTMPMAGAVPAPPPSQGSDVENRQEIIGPINSVAQIFYDSAISNFIQNNMQMDSEDIARKIWADYGGNEDGSANLSNIGKRTKENKKFSPEKAKEERDRTENSKWERLAEGLTIEDIVSFQDLGKLTQGLMYGIIMKAGAAAAAPPGGAPPALASIRANKFRIIIAKQLEKEYLFKESDTIIKDIYKNL